MGYSETPTIFQRHPGWKLDVCYSLGMSFAFFISMQLKHTPLAFLSPYFDQLIAIVIMLFMIPESIKMLLETFRELLLFSPDQETVDQIKQISEGILKDYAFTPVSPFAVGYLIVAVLALILYQGRKSWFEGPDDFDYV